MRDNNHRPVCPITLDEFERGLPSFPYSGEGLRRLHRNLEELSPLTWTVEKQIREAAARADKMSIQGMQPKLSAILKPKDGKFKIVDTGGRYILKPCPPQWREVPENEALTMTLAAHCGIEVPPHGLVAAAGHSWTYWIRRFDRVGRNTRIPVEDFAQLQGATRDTKYDSSLERVVSTINEFATFPAIERRKLAKRILFCFLTGNEDMHLKNFSLITRKTKVELSPAYDLLNTSIVLSNPGEESALPLRGKKTHLTQHDLVGYFCQERCRILETEVRKLLDELSCRSASWPSVVRRSFLSEEMKKRYLDLIEERSRKLFGD